MDWRTWVFGLGFAWVSQGFVAELAVESSATSVAWCRWNDVGEAGVLYST